MEDRQNSNGHRCYGLEYRSLKREPKAGRLGKLRATQAAVRIGQRRISNVQSEIEGCHAERMELGQSGGSGAQHAGEIMVSKIDMFRPGIASGSQTASLVPDPPPCANASGTRGGRACCLPAAIRS